MSSCESLTRFSIQRKNAREQKIFARFLMLSPKAQEYYQRLAERRLNARHHVQKIVALSEIYGDDAVARAIEDALDLEAHSSEYIANLLESRAILRAEPSALHLIRSSDLLEISLPEPNLTLYTGGKDDPTE